MSAFFPSFHFPFHTFHFITSHFYPRGWSVDVCLFRKRAYEQPSKSEPLRLCVCTKGEGGPRWRGTNEQLTGLLDCSMSFRSHIFKRCSRSFSSCSLVLRSLSSFLSLSSVASISHLQYTAAEQRYIKGTLWWQHFPLLSTNINKSE